MQLLDCSFYNDLDADTNTQDTPTIIITLPEELGWLYSSYDASTDIKCLILCTTVAKCTRKLCEDDLRTVLNYVWDARSRWYLLGVQLAVKVGDLEAIKSNSRDCDHCLPEVLLTWLRRVNPIPSWCSLIEALKKHPVGVQVTFEKKGTMLGVY